MSSSAPLDDVKRPVETAPPVSHPSIQADERSSPNVTGPDIERLATNAARFIEQSGRALAAYLKPLENGSAKKDDGSDILAVALTSIGKVAEHWTRDPIRLAHAQSAIATPFLQLWNQTYRRMLGETVEPLLPIAKGDKRYQAPEWSHLPLYDFLRQAHGITTNWADQLVDQSDELDPRTRAKAKFYLRQISSALSPANFIGTNPELLRQTIASNGDNLVRGAALLAEDMAAGGGQLRIRQTDATKFELGVNVATTPGKIIFRNDLIELIQYEPTTETVLKRPLLVIPPWINKFYIMDLNPEKSLVRWVGCAGRQPVHGVLGEPRRAAPGEDLRILHARRHLRRARRGEGRDGRRAGQPRSAIAWGCTLLSSTLAYMAETDDQRIASATFFAAQSDFTDAGDIQVFIDEEQIDALDAKMEDAGYLEGSKMAMAFNMLRPNDLVWSYVVDNYMARQTAGRLRPALLELRFNAVAAAQPLLLPSHLLHRQQARKRGDGHRRQAPEPRQGAGACLFRRDEGGPYPHPPSRYFAARSCSADRCATSSAVPGISRASSTRPRSGGMGIRPALAPRANSRIGPFRPSSTTAAGGRTGSPGLPRQAPERVAARRPGADGQPILGDRAGRVRPREELSAGIAALGRRSIGGGRSPCASLVAAPRSLKRGRARSSGSGPSRPPGPPASARALAAASMMPSCIQISRGLGLKASASSTMPADGIGGTKDIDHVNRAIDGGEGGEDRRHHGSCDRPRPG